MKKVERKGLIKGRMLAIAIAVTFLISLSIPLIGENVQSIGSNDSEIVKISIETSQQTQYLKALNVELIETYDSFVLVDITTEQKTWLEQRGFEIEELPYRTVTGRGAYVFDTKNGQPLFPSSLRINSYLQDTGGHYIVQFIGPVKEKWKECIQSMGAKIYDYIPNFAYIMRMNNAIKEKVEELGFVQWVGIYQPAYKLSRDIDDAKGLATFTVSLFKDSNLTYIADSVEDSGGKILNTASTNFNNIIEVRIDASALHAIANIESVSWIEPWYPAISLNNRSRGIIQSGIIGSTPIHDKGIHGENQLITMADTGLDYTHEVFSDSEDDPFGDDHRKIQDYYVPQGAIGDNDDDSGIGHGTCVGSIVLGDAPEEDGEYNTYNKWDGQAYASRIIVQDMADDFLEATGGLWPPADFSNMFQPAYDNGSRIHTDSWGQYGNYYTLHSAMIDEFMWDHKDFLILFAAGNLGPTSGSITGNANAKNTISVGASQNNQYDDLKFKWCGNPNNVSSFSSRGPAGDGRLKPTIIAPGEFIKCAIHNTTSLYYLFGGTSAATPAVAGAAALIRQYFIEGWYPNGLKNCGKSFGPSAALVKAVLINGAVEINGDGAYGYPEYNNVEDFYPNNHQGWGRINLTNSLYFYGDDRRLAVVDNTDGLATGETKEYSISVSDVNEPLEVTIVWTDYPGAESASPAIVNDLDLIVTSPNGDVYKGNVYTGKDPGYSIPNTGEYDRLNVEEGVLVLPPNLITGTYTIKISAHNVPNGENGKQPFALVVTGGLTEQIVEIVAASSGLVYNFYEGYPRQNTYDKIEGNCYLARYRSGVTPEYGWEFRSYFYFDTSVIPGLTISIAELRITTGESDYWWHYPPPSPPPPPPSFSPDLYSMEYNPITASDETVYYDTGDGTVYVNTLLEPLSTHIINLEHVAPRYIEDSVGSWFAIGMAQDWSTSPDKHIEIFGYQNPPEYVPVLKLYYIIV